MARNRQQQKAPVTDDMIAGCLARAVADGDIVNFRFLFISYSPLRQGSTEDITADKYAYLRPNDTDSRLFKDALALVNRPEIRSHARAQLEKNGPPQLPWQPLMLLADNAVRLGKHTAAAQAYELLRVRRRMQEEFLGLADAALDAGDIVRGVRGYIAGVGLDYDYAAFPEPLPSVLNYQESVLILHSEYPRTPEESLPLLPQEEHVRTALNFLLRNVEIAGRLEPRPLDLKVRFLAEWVRRTDSGWDAFVRDYRAAGELVREYGERLERAREGAGAGSLAEEVLESQESDDPRRIPALLAGRTVYDLEWWQYLKEMADRHPAGALFVARQVVARDVEIIMPRLRTDSALARELGLLGG